MLDYKFVAFGDHPAKGYWDQTMLTDLLADPLFDQIPNSNGAVIIIPGAYQAGFIKEINAELSKYTWVILFITSDEEGLFPIEKIKHKNMVVYIQYPKQGRHDKYKKWPLGYVTDTRKNVFLTVKDQDFFFSGQVTHKRRKDCVEQLKKMSSGTLIETDGFAQGIDQQKYMQLMCQAKTAPSPAGPISADAFRTYEALEAGAVPIADNLSARGDHDYWDYLFGSVPFPTISKYENLPGYIGDYVAKYPMGNNVAQAWWIKKKRDLKVGIYQDVIKLIGDSIDGQPVNIKLDHLVTVIIPVSPIKSHPSSTILDQTISSVRHHFPDAEIIITFDGVRKEQEDMRADYEEFTRHALFRCNTDWKATPIVFKVHTHQAEMAKVALESVITPLILYVEQDAPLVIDEPFDWPNLFGQILANEANVIRFHFESKIPKEHDYLMLGMWQGNFPGEMPPLMLQETIQWSQRPHLAATDFYRWMLGRYFKPGEKAFIEDKVHGLVQQDYAEMQKRGWDIWKLYIYMPDPRNIKRSLHLDGRAGDKKYS